MNISLFVCLHIHVLVHVQYEYLTAAGCLLYIVPLYIFSRHNDNERNAITAFIMGCVCVCVCLSACILMITINVYMYNIHLLLLIFSFYFTVVIPAYGHS